jgi:hypothetical protein
MTKFIGVLLGAVGVLLIVIVILIVRGGESPPEFDRVEIKATEGTQVFVKLSEGVEQYLDNVPATVDVPIGATVILRYNSQEKVYPNGTWQGGISHDFTATVSINAVPWAKVFIKLPEGDFIEPRPQDFTIPPEPNEKNSNVTPIRGGLKVPIGTTIKLVYGNKEKAFPYETWKGGEPISHDFLNQ